MTEYPTKTVTVADGDTETVYLDGHPRNDAVRADVVSGDSTMEAEFKVAYDDEPENIDPSTLETVHLAEVASGDSYTGAGTTALGRTVVVQVTNVETATDGDGNDLEVDVKAHPASDPAENGHGFAYGNTYRSYTTR